MQESEDTAKKQFYLFGIEIKQLYYSSAESYNSTYTINDISASVNNTNDADNDSIKYIYNWYVNNQIVEPYDHRKHSLSDGLFLPMIWNSKNKIGSYTNDGLSLRSEDNQTHLIVKKRAPVSRIQWPAFY
jgi:hypothetical protein